MTLYYKLKAGLLLAGVAAVALTAHTPADARGFRAAGGARTSLHAGGGGFHAGQAGTQFNTRAGQINRNSGNRIGNNNIAIGNNVNVNVDHDHWDHWDHWDHHPVAAGVAFGTAVAVTNAAIGSMIYSLPPSCSPYYYSVTYYSCGGVWYEPRYQGDTVTYIVVEKPAG